MKKQFVLFFLLLSALSVYGQGINTSKIDDFISHIENNNQGLGAIAISKDGKQVYQRRFGHASPQADESGRADLKYRIGSVTKMLTATMIYQLNNAGQLSLDEKIVSYFPTVPNADKISISNLLGHSSGLKDFVIKDDSLFSWLHKPASEKEILAEIEKQGILFQPGDSIRYSNSGYYLLSKILERKYNKPYPDILHEKILAPLGLRHTQSAIVENKTIALSYRLNAKNEWEKIEDFYFPNVVGVGDVASTPEDLNAIIYALFSSQLISPKNLKEMKPTGKELFGKGFMKLPFYEKTVYGHSGGTFGTHSIVVYNEEDNISVALNIHGQVFPLNQILIGILSIIYDKAYEFPEFSSYEAYDVNPESFVQYEGIYGAENFPLKIRIFKEADRLSGQATGQPSFALDAFADHKFRNSAAQLEIEFRVDQKQLILKQFGREFILTKE